MLKKQQYCFATHDERMREIYELAKSKSDLYEPVLICGASGCGKEVFAHYLHDISFRKEEDVEIINCASLSEDLLMQALFGKDHVGKFEKAGHGVIVLKNISEVSLKIQSKVAWCLATKVLHTQDGLAPFYGGVIFMSSHSWEELLNDEKLHPQLVKLLEDNVFELPALNQRIKDIPLLADCFLQELSRERGREIVFSPEVYHFLCQKNWRGNIHELKNFITRLAYFSEQSMIRVHDIFDINSFTTLQSSSVDAASLSHLYPMPLYELERKYIEHSIAVNKGNKTKTAQMLQISLKTLQNKLRQHQVPIEMMN